MNALGELLGRLLRLLAGWPLASSALATAAAALVATITSILLYRWLQSISRRLSAGPVFLIGATIIAAIYAVFLAYFTLTDRTLEEGVVAWLSGVADLPLHLLGTYRNAIVLAAFYFALQALYVLVVVLLAWLFGLLSGDDGGAARAVEAELGTSYGERLYKLCGYHQPDAPEKRFAEYGHGLAKVLRWAKWLSLPAALTGAIPAALWVVGSIVVDGFVRNLTEPARAPEEEQRGEEEAEAGQLAIRDPNQLVHALRVDERGPKLSIMAGGMLYGRPEHRASTTRVADESELAKDILKALEIEGFYVHQEAAAEAIFDGKDVLMETPPVSGRRTLCDVLAMRSVLLDGGTVLYLSPAAEESARRAAAFRELAQESNWRWAIFHHDLAKAGREGLDLKLRQPQIVFATPDELHRDLCPLAGDWDFFLRNLALVVAIDLDRYAGPHGSNLMYLMRRLHRITAQSAAPPRVLGTVAPYGPDVQGYAERLLARPLTVIGPESNSRGAPNQYVVVGTQAETQGLHPAVSSRGVAIACGYGAEVWGYDQVLSEFEQEQQVNKVLLAFSKAVVSAGDQTDLRFDEAEAVAVRLSSAQAAMISFFTCHTGRTALGVPSFSAQEVGERALDRKDDQALPFAGFERPDEDDSPPSEESDAPEEDDTGEIVHGTAPEADAADGEDQEDAEPELAVKVDMVVSIWLPDADSFASLLSRNPNWVHPSSLHPMLKIGSSLVASRDNLATARRHLLCAAREWPIESSEAARSFPAAAIDAVLAEAPGDERLFAHRRLRLEPDGAIGAVDELCFEGELATMGSTAVASELAGQLVNRSGGEVVLETDRIRLLTVAYPGRVLLRRGRRYRVLLPDEQGRVAEGVLWAEPERRRLMTTRIRELRLELEGQGHELDLGGSEPVFFHHPTVALTESVVGVRETHEARAYADMLRYEKPLEASYTTGAAVVHLPAASAEALEALEILVRVALPAFIKHEEDDIDVACLAGNTSDDGPTLVLLDRHPGGVGFARAVTAGVVRHVLYWSQQIAAGCGQAAPCTAHDGCRSCVYGGPILSPDSRPAPSRKAVVELLERILGSAPST